MCRVRGFDRNPTCERSPLSFTLCSVSRVLPTVIGSIVVTLTGDKGCENVLGVNTLARLCSFQRKQLQPVVVGLIFPQLRWESLGSRGRFHKGVAGRREISTVTRWFLHIASFPNTRSSASSTGLSPSRKFAVNVG